MRLMAAGIRGLEINKLGGKSRPLLNEGEARLRPAHQMRGIEYEERVAQLGNLFVRLLHLDRVRESLDGPRRLDA